MPVDLILLVADKNMQATLRGALSRPEALGIKAISFDFRVHPGKDGGVRSSGSELLAIERPRSSHALLVLDWHGSGANVADPMLLEEDLDRKLSVDWNDCAKSIVIDPEVDVWLWGSDSVLRDVFKWPLKGTIRDWLTAEGFQLDAVGKPVHPKEALEAMVRVHRKPRSSALYQKVAAKISLKRCQDPAFIRMLACLRRWFGPV